MEEFKIEQWGNTLSEYLYHAMRKHLTPAKAILSKSKTHPFGVFTDYVNKRDQLFFFEKELLNKLSSSQQPEIILNDYEQAFLPRIRSYKKWYAEHKKETEIFGSGNPYLILYEDAVRTEAAFLRHREVIGSKKDLTDDLIVKRAHLDLIFDKYGHYFNGETSQTWLARFSRNIEEMDPINVGREARKGSDRLVLIAILASISKTTGNDFDFDEFVSNHFGIASFSSVKSRSQDKQEFKDIVKYCDSVLNK